MSAGFGADLKAEESVETLVGDMPDVPCEHASHGTREYSHDDGPAKFYMQVVHACPTARRKAGEIYPGCARWAAFLSEDLPIRCLACGKVVEDRSEFVRVLGPVNQ